MGFGKMEQQKDRRSTNVAYDTTLKIYEDLIGERKASAESFPTYQFTTQGKESAHSDTSDIKCGIALDKFND